MVIRLIRVILFLLLFGAVGWELCSAQTVETVNEVRIVQNEQGGKYGRSLPLAIRLMRVIGDIDTEDENLAFNMPEDLAVDETGNIFILDSGNHRIQKFSPDGKHLATIGRRGQGPAEFNYPKAIDLDSDGNIYVLDNNQARILILNSIGNDLGTVPVDRRSQDLCFLKPGLLAVNITVGWDYDSRRIQKEGLPKLIRLMDFEGTLRTEFAEIKDFGGPQINDQANYTRMAADKDGRVYLTYFIRNKIDKYGSGGTHIWSASRQSNYSDKIEVKGKTAARGGSISQDIIASSLCSAGIAVDDKGRVWVIGFDRQMKKDEVAGVMSGMGRDGSLRFIKVVGNRQFLDQRETDIYKLEVFDSDGILQGEIPLTHFADRLAIYGDNLFILDKYHACAFYHYKIIEK